MFLMRDLYREEKPINYAESHSAGRELDKKYYLIPLKMRQSAVNPDEVTYCIDRDLLKYVVRLNKEGYRKLQTPFLSELASLPEEQRASF